MKIIYPNGTGGICVLHPTGELPIEEIAEKDVPAGLPFLYVNDDDLPQDRDFRSAWEADFSSPDGWGVGQTAWFEKIAKENEMKIRINLEKAKLEAHKIRRQRRNEEMLPHDQIIAKQIPGSELAQAEIERSKIRKKFEDMQKEIDEAPNLEEIAKILAV